eukprot:sb/3474595/
MNRYTAQKQFKKAEKPTTITDAVLMKKLQVGCNLRERERERERERGRERKRGGEMEREKEREGRKREPDKRVVCSDKQPRSTNSTNLHNMMRERVADFNKLHTINSFKDSSPTNTLMNLGPELCIISRWETNRLT